MVGTLQEKKGAKRRSSVALLLVDVINDMEFPGSSRLVRQAVRMAQRLAQLKARCVSAGCTVSNTTSEKIVALEHMQKTLKADIQAHALCSAPLLR